MSAGEFALVTRDELWSLGANPMLLEKRLIHGVALQRGGEIVASDRLDAECDRACFEAMERARRLCVGATPHLLRLVVTARRERVLETEVIGTLSAGGLSVVSDPEHIAEDAALLRRGAAEASADWRGLPIVWRNGSAAVWFHEAVGHASEHGHDALELPPGFHVDAPLEMRRASFTDVPLLRMRHVRVSYDGHPVSLPPRRLEVQLVAGGHYEPLTETVTIRVAAADLVERNEVTPVKPFTIVAPRRGMAIRGAAGPAVRYPGVVCSREGQELVVPSAAPVVVTES